MRNYQLCAPLFRHMIVASLLYLLFSSGFVSAKVCAAPVVTSPANTEKLKSKTPTASTDLALSQPIPSPEQLVARIRPNHPRLLATNEDFVNLRRLVQDDPILKQWFEKLQGRAELFYLTGPLHYDLSDRRNLLVISKKLLYRVYTLSLLYRIEGDRAYADRVWLELEEVAKFPDWNPSHFLDTAEITHAFAIAYDWLYDVWSPEQRDLLRSAIIKKGLWPALEFYRGTANYGGFQGWSAANHNWNQVCNGGISMGALAIADEAPGIAGEILHQALLSLPKAMGQFAPDGALREGPSYWDYATFYNVVIIAAFESALGTDFNLSQASGFSETGYVPLYLTGPFGRTFNYSDGDEAPLFSSQLFWLANKFGKPVMAQERARVLSSDLPLVDSNLHALDLLWGATWLKNVAPDNSLAQLPLGRVFRGAEVFTFRSSWNDPNALFIGFKAGDNAANHSHLDAGSFVLDAFGTRWALDLGDDIYNLPDYFSERRWSYYRVRAEGHNTLVIHPTAAPDQDPTAVTHIIRSSNDEQLPFVVADLTPAYMKNADKVHRGIAWLKKKQVLIQDEVTTTIPSEVWWFMHTRAAIEIRDQGSTAILTQDGRSLRARILSPAEGKFSVMEARPLPELPNPRGQNPNKGVHKLAIHLDNVQKLSLAVVLEPIDPEGKQISDLVPPELQPLAQWFK